MPFDLYAVKDKQETAYVASCVTVLSVHRPINILYLLLLFLLKGENACKSFHFEIRWHPLN